LLLRSCFWGHPCVLRVLKHIQMFFFLFDICFLFFFYFGSYLWAWAFGSGSPAHVTKLISFMLRQCLDVLKFSKEKTQYFVLKVFLKPLVFS
jgi:hypothetical protein